MPDSKPVPAARPFSALATPSEAAARGDRAAADAPETLRAYRACFRAWCMQEV